jgi:hypothetical protein
MASSTGTVIAVIQGSDGFRIAIQNTGNIAWAECHGNRIICSSAFTVCTTDQQAGTLGDVTFCLKPALVGDAFKHGKPFTMSGPGAGGTATFLVSTGVDPDTGAPLYTAPPGKKTFLVLDQKPDTGCCVGVESFFEINPDEQCLCLKRKVYNTCPTPTTVLMEKETYLLCAPGIFTVNAHVTQGEITLNGDIAHAFLSVIPGLNQNTLTAGSVEDGASFVAEFNACSKTAGLSTGQEVGTRWLELLVDLRPGGSTLKPAGKPGSERFFGHCLCLQCDTVPPGSGCIPVCIPIPEDPGGPSDHPCPLSQGYFKTHGSEWPVSSLVMGSQTYTKAEALVLLGAPVGGDASKILAKQLIGALLNIANGADPASILPTIVAANALLSTFSGKLPYGVAPSSSTGQQMTALASVLESYNLSKLTPGCKE